MKKLLFIPRRDHSYRRRSLSDAMSPESSLLRRTISVLALSAAALFLYRAAATSLRFFALSSSGSSSAFPYVSIGPDFNPDSEEYRLEKVLKDAAMDDKTVILTTLNEAWAAPNSVFDLFLESFRIGDRTRGLLNHLVIINLDHKAFRRCLAVHIHCVALVTEGVDLSREAYFMTQDYLTMMWRRIDFLRSVLEMGYNFIFTDADVMWFRDPSPRFYLDADFQIACDHFVGSSDGLQNILNGGFNYVKSNNRSVEFYKFWYSAREVYPGYHDQDVLNLIKFDPFIMEIGLRMRFLDTAYFGGLCEPSRDLDQVCTMHANCCIGLESKLHDLRLMLQDWKRFMSLPPNFRSSMSSWSVPQNCSIESLDQYDIPRINVQERVPD